MTEKQLISKIKELRQIKPRENWVFLTKQRILEREAVKQTHTFGLDELITGLRFVLGHKYAFASLVILIVLVGTFGFAQKSLPGDSLYLVRKMTEKSQAVFSFEGNQSKRNLELANKRLDDLTKIAQSNSVKNLATAINEYKATVSEATKSLIEDSEKDLEKVKEIVLEVRKLKENRQKVKALGVVIDGTEELNNALAQLVEREIKDLESRALTQEQEQILEEMKQDYENSLYYQSLERILLLTNEE